MILYIETNFLMGVATGRDGLLDDLLALPDDKLRIVLPTVCIMEAWSAFEDEQKNRNRFTQQLDQQITQLRRDVTSANASSLLRNIESARINNGDLLNDVKARLYSVMSKFNSGRIELLGLSLVALNDSLTSQVIEEPTDNLILSMIKIHAHNAGAEKKFLLTANTKDFHVAEVRQALEAEGVSKLFAETGHFLGWFNSELKKGAI